PVSDQIESSESLFFARPGLQKKLLRQFKRGALTIEDSLDLHGLNKVQAQQLLDAFLTQQSERQHRCVIVIHGKGIGSSSKQPVLKNLVFTQLKNDARILAFCSTQQRDGGTGAVYVLLKKTPLNDIDDH
ncbi:MAG: Smr/MutS family protein, partial [Cycloclasticus sp.]|nr:Smr/MutS family protein [Cycloclasticus sp.]MBQ0789109.1 Smr/MutS family protein [Cycloclasticus sp.]